MLIASIADIVSIGSIIPFLGILTDPTSVFKSAAAQPLITFLSISQPSELVLPLTLIFGVAVFLAGAVRTMLLWANARLSYALGADISLAIYSKTLHQSYDQHCNRNTSEVIDGMINKTGGVIYCISMLFTFITSIILISIIVFALLISDATAAFIVFGGIGILYYAVALRTKKFVAKNSQVIALESSNIIKTLQEGLGGIREVLLNGLQSTYLRTYQLSDRRLRVAQSVNTFAAQSPKYFMETIGLILMAGFAFVITNQGGGVQSTIPVLGALALGAQRLLPAMQQAYLSWSGLIGMQESLAGALELLEQGISQVDESNKLETTEFSSLVLENVCFRYEKSEDFIIKNLSISIMKGDRVGIIGSTGSGKSTLLDLMTGLLSPSSGAILINDQQLDIVSKNVWQKMIGYVSQHVYLMDGSIAQNIAFAMEESGMDSRRIQEAAIKAQLIESSENSMQRLRMMVGERGNRISGGQRQRIGIARAIYKNRPILVLDEATSALDYNTENKVMESIKNLDKGVTLIVVAHRLSTLRDCNKIIRIEDGSIVGYGAYEEFVNMQRNH
jgi:ABC-type multidrug transport system fused ATPase/permease subunit